MPQNQTAERLAGACVEARAKLRYASRALHDDVGSLLAVAGLRLQLVRMDHPELAARVNEVSEALEGVMDRVRKLTRELDPSPVARTGLKNALLDLAEQSMMTHGGSVTVRYTATFRPPPEIAEAIYLAAGEVMAAAAARKSVEKVVISAAGSKKVAVRIAHAGLPSAARRDLEPAALIARRSGLTFEVGTGRGTIVTIGYAMPRSSRR